MTRQQALFVDGTPASIERMRHEARLEAFRDTVLPALEEIIAGKNTVERYAAAVRLGIQFAESYVPAGEERTSQDVAP